MRPSSMLVYAVQINLTPIIHEFGLEARPKIDGISGRIPLIWRCASDSGTELVVVAADDVGIGFSGEVRPVGVS